MTTTLSTTKKPSLKIQTITPATAALLLKKNTSNRPIRRGVVEKYKSDMLSGSFTLSNTSIVIGSNGTLLDGQHRLLACVESNTAFDTSVLSNADPATFVNFDTGAKRTLADVLKLQGEPYAPTLAAGLRFMYLLDSGLLLKSGTGHVVSNTTALDYLATHPEMRVYAQHAATLNVKFSKSGAISVPATVTIGLFALAVRARGDMDEALQFMNLLIKPINQPEGSAVHAVISRLLTAKKHNETIPSRNLLFLLIEGFNRYVLDSPVKQLAVSPRKGEFFIPEVVAP